jgi:hypothetical protein
MGAPKRAANIPVERVTYRRTWAWLNGTIGLPESATVGHGVPRWGARTSFKCNTCGRREGGGPCDGEDLPRVQYFRFSR